MSCIQPVVTGLQSPWQGAGVEAVPASGLQAPAPTSSPNVGGPAPLTSVLQQVDDLLGQFGLNSSDQQMLRMILAMLILQAMLMGDAGMGGQAQGISSGINLLGTSSSMTGLSLGTGSSQFMQVTQSTLVVTGMSTWNAVGATGGYAPDQGQLDLSA